MSVYHVQLFGWGAGSDRYNPGHRSEVADVWTTNGSRQAGIRRALGGAARGGRLRALGLTLEVGLSQRMMAYYESPRALPPTDMLPALAQALGVSRELFLGTGLLPKAWRTKNIRLERRLKEIEWLGTREKRQLLQILDTFFEHEKLRRRASNEAERTT